MKLFQKIGIGVCIVGMIIAGIMFWLFQTESKEIQKISLQDIDMSQLRDGSYHGVYKTTLIEVEVKVMTKDCKIKEIDILKHNNGLGKDAEVIVEDMIKLNSDKVDTISGATYSSLVIQKAVNVALVKGMGKYE
ncbi:FMN-binding protein [Candidatus Stoquefichus massiliensis]|uniref:FMN-binding protein n=1 Tax=Candidatus Stoquefichus massiliensis TaxID=1470350 RepID=UPI00047F53FD|nr:FMN-binding protein [Candidatus Stoquefichus massiliensis]